MGANTLFILGESTVTLYLSVDGAPGTAVWSGGEAEKATLDSRVSTHRHWPMGANAPSKRQPEPQEHTIELHRLWVLPNETMRDFDPSADQEYILDLTWYGENETWYRRRYSGVLIDGYNLQSSGVMEFAAVQRFTATGMEQTGGVGGGGGPISPPPPVVLPPGATGADGYALLCLGPGTPVAQWVPGALPRIEWCGGVGDMVVSGDGHITGTDNMQALLDCLVRFNGCYLTPGKKYGFKRGVMLHGYPQFALGQAQPVVRGGGIDSTEVGMLDAVLAPTGLGTGDQVEIPWWVNGSWASDYFITCHPYGQNPLTPPKNWKVGGFTFRPNQINRPTKYAETSRTVIRLPTCLVSLYGNSHEVEDVKIISPGVGRGNQSGQPETFIIALVAHPQLPVSGPFDTTLGPFTFPGVGGTVTVQTIMPFYEVGDVVFLQQVGHAEVMAIAPSAPPDEILWDVTFKSVNYGTERGGQYNSNSPVSVTLDTPIIKPGFNDHWTLQPGPRVRRIKYVGPLPPAPDSDFDGNIPGTIPEWTPLVISAPGYRRQLFGGVVVEDIEFENCLQYDNGGGDAFTRPIHGVTVANTFGAEIHRVSGHQHSGALVYLDAWISLGTRIHGFRGEDVQEWLKMAQSGYGFIGSEAPTGKADSGSPFRVTPWWDLHIDDCVVNGRKMTPGSLVYGPRVFLGSMPGRMPAWGNTAHCSLDFHDNQVQQADVAPLLFSGADGYDWGTLRVINNVLTSYPKDSGGNHYLAPGVFTVQALAAGLRYCNRITWQNNRTIRGEKVHCMHTFESGGIKAEYLFGMGDPLPDYLTPTSQVLDVDGRVSLHVASTLEGRMPMRPVTTWTGGSAKLLLPKTGQDRAHFATATVVGGFPTDFYMPPGLLVRVYNAGPGTLTMEQWNKAPTPVPVTMTTIASGAVKEFLSANLANGHWIAP